MAICVTGYALLWCCAVTKASKLKYPFLEEGSSEDGGTWTVA